MEVKKDNYYIEKEADNTIKILTIEDHEVIFQWENEYPCILEKIPHSLFLKYFKLHPYKNSPLYKAMYE